MNSKSAVQTGKLYVVATPIGNLADITERAKQVLAEVNFIACEDTRHTTKLLHHLGIKKPLLAVHEHNERERIEQLASKLRAGDSIALVSDAGTPLISDPGYPLVQALREQNFAVVPIPGASALITALSAAGLPTDRFAFEGFLPAKAGPKRERLLALSEEPRTLVFYEAKHRIMDTLALLAELYPQRLACVARELTKTFETFYYGQFAEISACLQADSNQQKGEFVIVMAGNPQPRSSQHINAQQLLKRLVAELPPKKACAIVAEVTGENKKALYNSLLAADD